MKSMQNKFKKNLILTTFLVLFTLVQVKDVLAQIDYTSLSLEDLMNINVTSVSKRPQKIIDAASAIYVITQEDIRRSGATSIPDALRRVPGIQVAQINTNTWAITSRGHNSFLSNKLLVLIDGRTVYTPIFSGVYWDMKDTLLKDIDRIEVIRGPGASLWGDNAVNGVINIITKHAGDTQGGLLSTGYGEEQQGFGNLRYGSMLGNDAYFRVYGKYFNRDNSVFTSGGKANDRWDMLRGGFRIDWDVNFQDSLTLQGDIYDGESGSTETFATLTSPYTNTINYESELAGWNVLTRWKHTFSESSNLELQLYFNRTERESAMLREDRDTYDLDFQHRFRFGNRQDIVWGVGYRFSQDNIRNSFSFTFDPETRSMPLYSGFVHDEITLIEDRLRLTVGSKFSHNIYTGLEVQPTARLLWKPRERHSVWTSWSRAVRTPSRGENDARLNSKFVPSRNTLAAIFSDHGYESEVVYSYELGYRFSPSENLSVDTALYYNNYDKYRTIELGTPFLESTHYVSPSTADNEAGLESFGAEVSVDLRPVDWWHLKASYSYQQILMHLNKSSSDTISETVEGTTPHNQFFLRSSFDLPWNTELDLSPRYADNLPALEVDSYVELDARLAWKPLKNLEISLIGQNLLDNNHSEYVQDSIISTGSIEIERSVFAKIEWKF